MPRKPKEKQEEMTEQEKMVEQEAGNQGPSPKLTRNLRKLKTSEAFRAFFVVTKYFPQIRAVIDASNGTIEAIGANILGQLAVLNGEEFISDYLKFANILLQLEPEEIDSYDAADVLAALKTAWEINGLGKTLTSMFAAAPAQTPDIPKVSENSKGNITEVNLS